MNKFNSYAKTVLKEIEYIEQYAKIIIYQILKNILIFKMLLINLVQILIELTNNFRI